MSTEKKETGEKNGAFRFIYPTSGFKTVVENFIPRYESQNLLNQYMSVQKDTLYKPAKLTKWEEGEGGGKINKNSQALDS